jgi:hypothetical protein
LPFLTCMAILVRLIKISREGCLKQRAILVRLVSLKEVVLWYATLAR